MGPSCQKRLFRVTLVLFQFFFGLSLMSTLLKNNETLNNRKEGPHLEAAIILRSRRFAAEEDYYMDEDFVEEQQQHAVDGEIEDRPENKGQQRQGMDATSESPSSALGVLELDNYFDQMYFNKDDDRPTTVFPPAGASKQRKHSKRRRKKKTFQQEEMEESSNSKSKRQEDSLLQYERNGGDSKEDKAKDDLRSLENALRNSKEDLIRSSTRGHMRNKEHQPKKFTRSKKDEGQQTLGAVTTVAAPPRSFTAEHFTKKRLPQKRQDRKRSGHRSADVNPGEGRKKKITKKPCDKKKKRKRKRRLLQQRHQLDDEDEWTRNDDVAVKIPGRAIRRLVKGETLKAVQELNIMEEITEELEEIIGEKLSEAQRKERQRGASRKKKRKKSKPERSSDCGKDLSELAKCFLCTIGKTDIHKDPCDCISTVKKILSNMERRS